ncbi:MAG: CRISPR-associated helicase Cas3' [Armatimonadota bacterium]|nr:CRISPR-associated helicase Cas3' [Armatimonadota bacterium]
MAALEDLLQTVCADTTAQLFDFQKSTAHALFVGHNIVLRVPTGCGKTWAAVLPFLLPEHWKAPPHRLIYVLPLRTLIDSVADLLRETLPLMPGWRSDHIKVQTGANVEDPFLSEARIVVTTFDQLLSGLLGAPYGKGPSLHNINSAALAGCLVVFDEFHLMEADKAFMTALAGCKLFEGICQSVWMTATATSPLCDQLTQHLGAVPVGLTHKDTSQIKALRAEKRVFIWDRPIRASDITQKNGKRLVVVNQVKRAQKLYLEVKDAVGDSVPVVLLHSRFLTNDRAWNQSEVLRLLGKPSKAKEAIVIATQVVEAGLDISADFLFTELAPANSIVQRAGRCARYGGYGEIHVFALPEEENCSWLPYGTTSAADKSLNSTCDRLRKQEFLSFKEAVDLVEDVHLFDDQGAVALGSQERLQTLCAYISQNNIQKAPVPVTHLIREADLSANLVIADVSVIDDDLPAAPWGYEGIKVSVHSLRKLKRDCPDASVWRWSYSSDGIGYWERCDEQLLLAFHYLVTPSFAKYTSDCGLELGEYGEQVSLIRDIPQRPGYLSTARESWVDHATNVRRFAIARRESEAHIDGYESLLTVGFRKRYGINPDGFVEALSFMALAHDLGKLQQGWQEWAEDIERSVDSDFHLDQPLAHTSTRSDSVSRSKPRHALQGAYLAYRLLEENKESFSFIDHPTLVCAVLPAIIAHHGGGVYSPSELQAMSPLAGAAIRKVFGASIRQIKRHEMTSIMDMLDQKLQKADFLREYWPVVAYITRILRLSDQAATAEGGNGE